VPCALLSALGRRPIARTEYGVSRYSGRSTSTKRVWLLATTEYSSSYRE
jgi:hypothetical protein